MTITTAQAFTKMINGIEAAEKGASKYDPEPESRELMRMVSTEYPNLKKLDDWEVILTALMFDLAVSGGLAKTKKVEENFRALDVGMTLLSTMVIHCSENDQEIATNLANQTRNIQQTYMQASVTAVRIQQGEKAGKKLSEFIEGSSPKSMTKIMEENIIKGSKN